MQIRNERDVDKQTVFAPDLQRDLAHRFDKRLAFDVADGAADLCDDHVGARLFAHAVDEILDLVGHMRDHLHRGAEVFAAALLVEHVPVDLAGREIGIAVEVLVDEPFVVAEIEISLRAVLGHIHFAVLIRTHRAGIDVDIGVKLLRGDLEATRLEQPPERRGGDAFAEAGHHAAGDEDVFCHIRYLPPNYFPLSP